MKEEKNIESENRRKQTRSRKAGKADERRLEEKKQRWSQRDRKFKQKEDQRKTKYRWGMD